MVNLKSFEHLEEPACLPRYPARLGSTQFHKTLLSNEYDSAADGRGEGGGTISLFQRLSSRMTFSPVSCRLLLEADSDSVETPDSRLFRDHVF